MTLNRRKNQPYAELATHVGAVDPDVRSVSDQERARTRAIERLLRARGMGESVRLESYSMRLTLQRNFARWCWDNDFDFMVTINSNDRRVDYERGRIAMRKFGALLDRYFLGKNWCRFRSNERTLFFAIPEFAGDELHYHILVRIPPKARKLGARHRMIPNLTLQLKRKHVFPSCDAHTKRLKAGRELEDSWRQLCTVCYVVKEVWRPEHLDNCIISTMFHPTRS